MKTRLIDELLPEAPSILLPRELSERKAPSEICNLLNRDPESPFHNLIKRISEKSSSTSVIADAAIIAMIRNSMDHTAGALAPYKSSGRDRVDVEDMYHVLVTYWCAVRDVFPEAWGVDPRRSRLMHAAGIKAMGFLMDRIYARLSGHGEDYKTVRRELEKVAPVCRWTNGTWESLGFAWNEIQNTHHDIRKLQGALVQAYTRVMKE